MEDCLSGQKLYQYRLIVCLSVHIPCIQCMSIYSDMWKLVLSFPCCVADTNTSREYAVPDNIPKSSLLVNIPTHHNTMDNVRPPTLQKKASSMGLYGSHIAPTMAAPHAQSSPYATSDLAALPNIQGVSGNNVYGVPNDLDMLWTEDFSVIEFPRENLQFVEKLGEGQFGEVGGVLIVIGMVLILGSEELPS